MIREFAQELFQFDITQESKVGESELKIINDLLAEVRDHESFKAYFHVALPVEQDPGVLCYLICHEWAVPIDLRVAEDNTSAFLIAANKVLVKMGSDWRFRLPEIEVASENPYLICLRRHDRSSSQWGFSGLHQP